MAMAFQPREERRTHDLDLFIRKVAVVVGVVLLLALLWAARDVVLLVFIAAVLAAGISPAVHRVRVWGRLYFRKRFARGTAVLLVFFPFLLLLGVLLVVMVPRLMVESHALAAQLPALVEDNILTPLERYLPMGGVRSFLRGGVELPRGRVFGYVRSAATLAASVVAVLFMIVYMLIDAHRLRNLILLFYPASVRGERRRMLTRMADRMSSWLSGQLILSAIIGVATFVVLLALRIPYALPLAIVATIGEMVPVIGPIVGMSPALAMAILHSRWQFWSLLVAVLVMQKAENLFIAPRVMARKVSISPLTVFIAFLIGGSVLGIVGAIIAIPVAAILHVVFDEAFVAHRERRQDLDRAGTLVSRT
jgi:predicted PurR-regulated permease PerM